MGIFSTTSPFDEDVERVTDEKNTTENWGLIMDVCDRAASNPKDALRSIVRRLNDKSPHVQLQSITLLDACISNSGKPFHLEVASREFEQEFRKLVLSRGTHKRVSTRLLSSLQKWTETEFRSDPQLALIPSLYNSLRQYSKPEDAPERTSAPSRDPDVVSSQQEEDDIAKAIALSMKDAERAPRASSSSLYPSTSGLATSSPSTSSSSSAAAAAEAPKTERKVRALYDFEAAEDNELTFKAGEIILVTECGDPNWWLGSNHRGQGLFPSNFITSDLSEEPEQWKDERQQRKSVQFNEEVEVKEVEQQRSPEVVTVDEHKIGELLHMLNEADPTGDRPDTTQLLALEEQCLAMGPLIDQELERTDRRHAQLTKISADLVDALNLYHQLMREPPPTAAPPAFFPPGQMQQMKQYGHPAPYYAPMAPPPGGVMPPPGPGQHPPPLPQAGMMPMMAPQFAPGPHDPQQPPPEMEPQGRPPQFPDNPAAMAPLPPPGVMMAPGAPHLPPWGHHPGGGEMPPPPQQFAGYPSQAGLGLPM